MRLLSHTLAAPGLLLLLASPAHAQYYHEFAMVDADLAPGYWHPAAAQPPALAKRDGDCGTGKHPCSDVNSTLCCPNDTYCVINGTTWEPFCCSLGLDCDDTCSASQYLTNYTTTTTASGGSTTTQTLSACAVRRCTSAYYECPSSLGGQCCGFGSECGTNSQGTGICLSTAGGTTATSTAMSTVVSPVASGCSEQGQTYCTTGGGCCGAGFACAIISSSVVCVTSSSTAAAPTGSGITVEHQTSGGRGLSAGAKAGIAIGVVAAAAAVIGLLTWFCLRRRRAAGRSTTGTGTGAAGAGGRGAQEMQGIPAARASRTELASDGGIRSYGASSGPHMSEADGATSYGYPASSVGTTSRAGGYGGPAGVGYQEYDVVGPYYPEMGAGGIVKGGGGGAAAKQQRAVSPGGSEDAVPLHDGQGRGHHGLEAVPVPVEIGTRDSLRRPAHARIPSDRSDGSQSELADTSAGMAKGRIPATNQPQASPVDNIANVFELYGSPAGPAGAQGGGEREVYHDAPEGPFGSAGHLPQPLPTPGSEPSEYGPPSPMSREEEQQPHREV